jgi:hypothetical protein
MVNPQNVQAKVKRKLETVSYWSDRTSRALDLIILSVSNSTPPPAPFTLQDWSNILQSIQTSSSNVNYIEDTVAKTIYDIIIRLEKGWRAEDAAAQDLEDIADFRTAVHSSIKAGVEAAGGVYEGARRDFVTSVLNALQNGTDVMALLNDNPVIV